MIQATTEKKTIRCAIYARKSHEEGLEQEFNSLHAQREAAEAFISSQRHEGWVALPMDYNDGGFSGGTALSGPMPLSANGGFALPAPADPAACWFKTAVGKKLNLYLSAAKQVSGAVVYYEE